MLELKELYLSELDENPISLDNIFRSNLTNYNHYTILGSTQLDSESGIFITKVYLMATGHNRSDLVVSITNKYFAVVVLDKILYTLEELIPDDNSGVASVEEYIYQHFKDHTERFICFPIYNIQGGVQSQ